MARRAVVIRVRSGSRLFDLLEPRPPRLADIVGERRGICAGLGCGSWITADGLANTIAFGACKKKGGDHSPPLVKIETRRSTASHAGRPSAGQQVMDGPREALQP